MKGAAKDLMNMCIGALASAYSDINGMKAGYAVNPVDGGKSDTYRLDQATEECIKHWVDDYDPNIVLVTEETGKMYHGERGMEPTQTVLIADPTDRSIKLKEFLDARIDDDIEQRDRYVRDILRDGMNIWERELGCAALSGATGSITAIRGRRILFSVMVNYVTGHMFVSCPLGNRCGEIKTPFDDYENVEFPQYREGGKFATFLGKKGYAENLEQSQLGLSSQDCADEWAPGPARILQLSNLNPSDDVGFILSNGEKIGEWIGWLSWVKYARDRKETDERSMTAHRVFFECPRTKEHVLVAPAPHYSIFRDEGPETRINLDMMFQLEDPSHYRETMVIVPVHNLRMVSRVKSLGRNHHELKL